MIQQRVSEIATSHADLIFISVHPASVKIQLQYEPAPPLNKQPSQAGHPGTAILKQSDSCKSL